LGEHDQTAPHDQHPQESIHDDGRALAEVELGAGAGANDPDNPDIYKNTPVFRFAHDKLLPETVHVRLRPFHVTKWESVFSTVFGTGSHPDWVSPSVDPGLEPSFTPIIDENYRVVGHMGWIGGPEICVPRNTVAWDSPIAQIFEKARLGEDRRRLLARQDRDPMPPFAARRVSPEPDTEFLAAVRRGGLKDASEEERHRSNLNYFLAGGGAAVVGRDYVHEQMADQKFEPFLPGDYQCMALVNPDGYLQSVLRVEKIHHESRDARILRIALEVIDIALTIWMIIEIATISVGLLRLGVLLARAATVRAIELAADQAAKAALRLAEREARRAAAEAAAETELRGAASELETATEAELNAARGGNPGSGKPRLMSAEDLNKPVPQVKGVTGPKRMLERPERAGANKVLGVLENVRSGPAKTAAEIQADIERQLPNHRVQPLTRDLQGWTEIDLLEGNPGAYNDMRIIYKVKPNGEWEVRLRQMH
jgi:hypothetical protein